MVDPDDQGADLSGDSDDRPRRKPAGTGAGAARGASSAARQAAAQRASRRTADGPRASRRGGNGGRSNGGNGGQSAEPASLGQPGQGPILANAPQSSGASGPGGDTGGTTRVMAGGATTVTADGEPTGELTPTRVQTISTTPTTYRRAPSQAQPAQAEPSLGSPEDYYTVQLPPPKPKRPWDPIVNQFLFFGDLALFIIQSVAYVPLVLIRYRKEFVRLIGDVTFGSKALAVLASTVMVAAVLSAVVGVQLALEGYQGLDVIGLGPLAGYLSAFANTRELTPLLTAFGLAAQMGCRFTSELGAMAVTDEIAALEVMSIPSQAYLVTTRVMAALTVTIPLFLLALAGSYLATEITVVAVAHQGSGTYLHYFHEFLAGKDIILATLKVVIFSIFITTIHCFYGYTTTGGPENVGKATGRAIRASIVTIAVTDMLMTILFWGTSSGIKVTG